MMFKNYPPEVPWKKLITFLIKIKIHKRAMIPFSLIWFMKIVSKFCIPPNIMAKVEKEPNKIKDIFF